MAPHGPPFDLNEAPPGEDIEDDVAMACESSQSQRPPLEVNGGRDDGSTARGLPSPPAPEVGNTGDTLAEDELGDALPESELLVPVLDLDALLSPIVDEDEEEDDDLPRPPDDPDGGRSPGPSCFSERMASDRSTFSHAKAAVLTTPCSHGGRTSPRTSLPDFHDTKTLSPAFAVLSSSENNSASRVDGIGDTGTASPSHMPRRHKSPPVPRDDYFEESGTSYGGASRRGGPPSTLHHERSMRSHPYAMQGGQGTPRMNQRRRRPKRQVYNGDDQRRRVYNNGQDQRQRVYDGHDQRQQVNNYHDQRQVYNNYQDQRQQVNNGRDLMKQVYNNARDQRQQQVYNNGHHQRRQGHHGHRRPEVYQDRKVQHHGYPAPNRQGQLQGYSSGTPFAGQYAGEDSYGGGRQIPAKQQPSSGGGYQKHREPPRGQQRHVKPYHPYARDADASVDRTNAGKQANHQPWAYRQHQRNSQSTAGGPVRRRQYYGDLYN